MSKRGKSHVNRGKPKKREIPVKPGLADIGKQARLYFKAGLFQG
jgi:hypothetical protein